MAKDKNEDSEESTHKEESPNKEEQSYKELKWLEEERPEAFKDDATKTIPYIGEAPDTSN